MTEAATVVAAKPRRSRSRRFLAGIALVLACLTILVTTVAVWTHQVALNTNRFTSLVGTAVTDPAVTDPISTRISIQVVDAMGVQERLEARLPDAIKPLAGALTAAVTERIDQRLKVALQDPRLQNALVQTLSFSHAQIVRLLRGESDALGIVDGYLTLDVFPVVGIALTELQSMGIIPADAQLPDLSAPDAPQVLAQRLNAALGITLPPDFGTIRLMPAARLATARTVVQVFDYVVILLVILSAALVALALWLSADRRRMLIYLGIGVIVAFLLARLAMGAAENVVIGGIAEGDIAGATRTIVDATLQDLRGITVIILIATVVLVIAAYLWGRPQWAVTTASYVTDTAGRAGSAAGAGAVGAAERAPDRETIEKTVRENRSLVERFGLASIVFFIVWIGLGLEIALLGAALVIGFQLVLRVLTGPPEDEAMETAAAETPVSAVATPVVPPAAAAVATPAPAPTAAADATERVVTPKQPAKASPAADAPKAAAPAKPAAKTSAKTSPPAGAPKAAAPAKPPAKKPASTSRPPKPKPPTS